MPIRPSHIPTLSVLTLSAGAALLLGCTGHGDLTRRLEASQAEGREEVASLRRELDAVYDRERAMAERLRRAEEGLAVLQARVAQVGERIDSLGRPSPESAARPGAARAGAPPFDAVATYQAAYRQHQEHDHEAAIAGFIQVLQAAPHHSLADNAQYWIGESDYALGRYRDALAAFTKVLAYETTEKDDDAQLMIARSHLALGERGAAVSAFRRLLSQHPDSEYAGEARRELRHLEGQ